MRNEKQREVAAAWGGWVADMGEWHVFGGLTYRQRERTTMPGADVVRAHVKRWLRDAPKSLGRPVEAAVVAVEHHKSGWPHAHPLLRLPGGLQPGDLARLGQAWYRPHGYARLEQPRDELATAAYAAKYLAKDLDRGDVIFWPLRGDLRVHQAGL